MALDDLDPQALRSALDALHDEADAIATRMAALTKRLLDAGLGEQAAARMQRYRDLVEEQRAVAEGVQADLDAGEERGGGEGTHSE